MICSAIYHHDDKLVTDSAMDEVLKDADVIHHVMNDLSKAVYTRFSNHKYDINSDDAQYEERSFREWYKIVLEGFSEYGRTDLETGNGRTARRMQAG